MKVFIKEYIPPQEVNYIEYKKNTKLFKVSFYDPQKHIVFSVLEEPDWLHMEEDKVYEFRYSSGDDCFHYKLWKRIDTNTVIIAEYYSNWYITEEKYLSESLRKITVEDFLKENE